jgi:hypothetical protein
LSGNILLHVIVWKQAAPAFLRDKQLQCFRDELLQGIVGDKLLQEIVKN